jgi:hypothetical protein
MNVHAYVYSETNKVHRSIVYNRLECEKKQIFSKQTKEISCVKYYVTMEMNIYIDVKQHE